MTTATQPLTVGVARAAEVLGVHRRTVLRMIQAGTLEADKHGPATSSYAILTDSLDHLLEERGQK